MNKYRSHNCAELDEKDIDKNKKPGFIKANMHFGLIDKPKREILNWNGEKRRAFKGIEFLHSMKINMLDLSLGGNFFDLALSLKLIIISFISFMDFFSTFLIFGTSNPFSVSTAIPRFTKFFIKRTSLSISKVLLNFFIDNNVLTRACEMKVSNDTFFESVISSSS